MNNFYFPFDNTIKKAEEALEKIKIEIKDEVTDEICEKCGRNMVIKVGRYGKFLACPGFPECRNAKPIVEELGVKCPKCGSKILIKKTRKGKKYYACEKSPDCDFVSWDKLIAENCPQCGSYMIEKNGRKICANKNCISSLEKV